MAVTELATLYTTASAALDSGDYAAAIRAALKAKALIATTPNATREQFALSWNPQGIDSFIATCRELQKEAAHAAKTGPYQVTAVEYARCADTGDTSYT